MALFLLDLDWFESENVTDSSTLSVSVYYSIICPRTHRSSRIFEFPIHISYQGWLEIELIQLRQGSLTSVCLLSGGNTGQERAEEGTNIKHSTHKCKSTVCFCSRGSSAENMLLWNKPVSLTNVTSPNLKHKAIRAEHSLQHNIQFTYR